jgi:hypothetical protein
LKHCYSIAYQDDRFRKCPSYHLWDVCDAKGSQGCLGYNAAIALYCCSLLCTFAVMHALWSYLKGDIRTFKVALIPSNVVSLLPGVLSLSAVAAVWLQPPPYRANLWWNFYLQLVVGVVLCITLCCMQPRGMNA